MKHCGLSLALASSTLLFALSVNAHDPGDFDKRLDATMTAGEKLDPAQHATPKTSVAAIKALQAKCDVEKKAASNAKPTSKT